MNAEAADNQLAKRRFGIWVVLIGWLVLGVLCDLLVCVGYCYFVPLRFCGVGGLTPFTYVRYTPHRVEAYTSKMSPFVYVRDSIVIPRDMCTINPSRRELTITTNDEKVVVPFGPWCDLGNRDDLDALQIGRTSTVFVGWPFLSYGSTGTKPITPGMLAPGGVVPVEG